MNIGWIGTGVMGQHMLTHLQQGGHKLFIYNRTKSKALALANENIIVCDSIEEVVKNSNIVFTMVGYPSDVKQTYLGEKGIINYIHNNLYCCVDMTTSSPSLAKDIAKIFFKKGIYVLDAPVSGGEIGARDKKLSIMVGGNRLVFDRYLHLFQLMGENINYVGPSGYGMHTKIANQIAIAGTIAATCESLYYCYLKKLNPNTVMQCISTGAASSWQLINNGKNIIDNNYNPGFYIKHFIKDMQIAVDQCYPNALVVTNIVLDMYKKLANTGFSNFGTQALIYYYLNS